MSNILSNTDFLAMGFKIGTEIKTAFVTAAIEEAELAYVKRAIGDASYIALSSDTSAVVAGGSYTDADGGVHYLAGLKKAIGNIAFACLLRADINATNFGSVEKTDEHSRSKDPWEVAKYHYNIGIQYLRELEGIKGIHVTTFSNYFTEL